MSKKQDGFASLETALFGVIILMVAFIGWYVWHSTRITNKNLDQTLATQNSSVVKPSSGKSSGSSSSNGKKSSPGTAQPKYLVITQWGVKLPLSSDISDAYYAVPEGSRGFPNAYGLGTKSLTALDQNCAPDKVGVVFIYRQTSATHDQNVTHKDPMNYPVYTSKVGNYYYGPSLSQSACSNQTSVNKQQQALFAPFQAAIDGIT